MSKIKRINNRAFLILVCLVVTTAVVSYSSFAFASGLELTLTGGDWDVSSGGACDTGGVKVNGLCWYLAATGNSTTCDDVCAAGGRGGCRSGNWDLDASCTACNALVGYSPGCYPDEASNLDLPLFADVIGTYCFGRSPGSVAQDCGAFTGIGNYYRLCVCETGSQATLGPEETVSTSTTKWTVTGSSNGSEHINALISGIDPTDWTHSATDTPLVNQFVLKVIPAAAEDAEVLLWDVSKRLKSYLSKSSIDTYQFGLEFTAPSTGSGHGPHNITITLTASSWWSCDGYSTGGDCYYGGAEFESCTSVCSSHGGIYAPYDGTDAWDDDANCTICRHLFPTPYPGCLGDQSYGDPNCFLPARWRETDGSSANCRTRTPGVNLSYGGGAWNKWYRICQCEG